MLGRSEPERPAQARLLKGRRAPSPIEHGPTGENRVRFADLSRWAPANSSSDPLRGPAGPERGGVVARDQENRHALVPQPVEFPYQEHPRVIITPITFLEVLGEQHEICPFESGQVDQSREGGAGRSANAVDRRALVLRKRFKRAIEMDFGWVQKRDLRCDSRFAQDKRRDSGRFASLVAFPCTCDFAVLVKSDLEAVNVHIFGGIQVRAAVKDEDQMFGR
jgi:hypothetical protein